MPTCRFHPRHITILDGYRSRLLSERSAVRTDLFKALTKLLVPAIGAAFALVAIRAFLEHALTFHAQADKATIFSRRQLQPAGDKSVMSQMGH